MAFPLNIWTLIFLAIVFIGLSIFFVWPWLFGAPFEPSKEGKVRKMIKLSKIKKGEKAVDLGSGDGRILIALAKKGAIAHGYEINPFLVLISRRNIKNAGLSGKAFVHWKSFWKVNLGDFGVIILFQFPTIMDRLQRKIKKESKPGTRIVSEEWKFKNWAPKEITENLRLYIK